MKKNLFLLIPSIILLASCSGGSGGPSDSSAPAREDYPKVNASVFSVAYNTMIDKQDTYGFVFDNELHYESNMVVVSSDAGENGSHVASLDFSQENLYYHVKVESNFEEKLFYEKYVYFKDNKLYTSYCETTTPSEGKRYINNEEDMTKEAAITYFADNKNDLLKERIRDTLFNRTIKEAAAFIFQFAYFGDLDTIHFGYKEEGAIQAKIDGKGEIDVGMLIKYDGLINIFYDNYCVAYADCDFKAYMGGEIQGYTGKANYTNAPNVVYPEA